MKLLILALIILASCSAGNFEKNLECEKLKDSIQYNSDNYSEDGNIVISKIQKVFYSPKLDKCLYVSVASFDINAPNDLATLSESDYEDGARWKLRTVSGEVIEDLMINITGQHITVFGKQPEHTGSYDDFVQLVSKWE